MQGMTEVESSQILTKDLVASTRTTYPHHYNPQETSSAVLDLFEHGYRYCSHLVAIEGQTSTGRTRSSTYLQVKTQFRIDTATQAGTWTTLRSLLHVHMKVFCGGVKKLCGWPFKMRSIRLVETETFFGVTLLVMYCSAHNSSRQYN